MNVYLRMNKLFYFAMPYGRRYLFFFCIVAFILVFSSPQINARISDYSNIYALEAKTENSQEIRMDEKIRIIFNQPVILLGTEKINANPAVEIQTSLTENNKVLEVNFAESLRPETKYEISIKNVRAISGTLLPEKKFIFYTSASKPIANKMEMGIVRANYAVFELSKDKYIPPAVSRPDIEYDVEPKVTQGKFIDVSIDHEIMTLFEDGIKINSFLVSSGMPGHSTPVGTYSVQGKEANHWSGYGLWMPYSLNFSGPYYIHELPYWPGGYREGENHLGHLASHGCIRLGMGPAEYVYEWANIGTPIYIHK